MVSGYPPASGPEEFLAELTDAAYRVALKHGFKSSFLEVQLDLWTALRQVVRDEVFAGKRSRPRAIVEK